MDTHLVPSAAELPKQPSSAPQAPVVAAAPGESEAHGATAAPEEPASPSKPVPRKRVPAEERREQVLRAAAEVIARQGMHAASTAEIAKLSGISHAYLFRLFPTKEELLCAVARENGRVMLATMTDAGERAKARGEDPMMAMALAWKELLTDQTLLQVNLHGVSASSGIPAVGEQMRACWEDIVAAIERITEAGPDEVRGFIAQGMLLLVISGLGAHESDWATRLHHGPLPFAAVDLGCTVD